MAVGAAKKKMRHNRGFRKTAGSCFDGAVAPESKTGGKSFSVGVWSFNAGGDKVNFCATADGGKCVRIDFAGDLARHIGAPDLLAIGLQESSRASSDVLPSVLLDAIESETKSEYVRLTNPDPILQHTYKRLDLRLRVLVKKPTGQRRQT